MLTRNVGKIRIFKASPCLRASADGLAREKMKVKSRQGLNSTSLTYYFPLIITGGMLTTTTTIETLTHEKSLY